MPAEVETMFYYNEVPWHGLGTKVDHALTAAEAITTAGLDWEVATVPIYVNNVAGIKGYKKIDGKKAVARLTDGKVLGVLGDGYTPVQNKDAFNFFDDVVATKEAKYHTAGSLQGGGRVWILAKLDGKAPISIKGDPVDKYLLLMNGHDGKLALKMFFTPVRVVCMNTLMAAEAGAARGAMFYSRHTEGIGGRIEHAREILGITLKFYERFTEQATHLATLQLPAPQFPLLLAAAFGTAGAIRPQDVVQLDDLSTRRQEQFATVQRLFEGEGKGLDTKGIKGTKWAAYNAVVEYVDYAKKYGGANPDDLRLKNTWFSRGARIKQRAWDYLIKAK